MHVPRFMKHLPIHFSRIYVFSTRVLHIFVVSPLNSSYYINNTLRAYRGTHCVRYGIHSCCTYKVLSLLSSFFYLPPICTRCVVVTSLSVCDYHASLRAYRAASCATYTLRPYTVILSMNDWLSGVCDVATHIDYNDLSPNSLSLSLAPSACFTLSLFLILPSTFAVVTQRQSYLLMFSTQSYSCSIYISSCEKCFGFYIFIFFFGKYYRCIRAIFLLYFYIFLGEILHRCIRSTFVEIFVAQIYFDIFYSWKSFVICRLLDRSVNWRLARYRSVIITKSGNPAN